MTTASEPPADRGSMKDLPPDRLPPERSAGPTSPDPPRDGQTRVPLLDLRSIRLAELKPRPANKSERLMKLLGFPLGLLVFVGLLVMPAPAGLSMQGQICLAAFGMALVWWTTEPFPTYLASLILILTLILSGGWEEKKALGVLGLDVIWLNVMAFVLSSLMVKTNLAKRVALRLIVIFGKNARSMLFAFLLLQLFLAPLIPATAARTVLTLPILLLVAALFGSTTERPNNFGKVLLLHNLHGINTFSSGFITGSTANLIAIGFISSMAGRQVFYTDWMFANLPVVCLAMLASWWGGRRLLFRIPPGQDVPLAGGRERMREELKAMGPMAADEWRALAIFGLVLFLWVTDRYHEAWFGFTISPVVAAAIGAVVTLLPRIGVLQWNEADIPWHLMLFSAGAYAGGLALRDSGAARWAVELMFQATGIGAGTSFWTVYVVVIALNMYSHIFFTSKTMRTIIMIPFVITMAQELGFDPLALALPAAFTIDWVNTLPINAKPNVILFATGQYSALDSIRYGLFITTVGTLLLILAGLTWFRFLGITAGY